MKYISLLLHPSAFATFSLALSIALLLSIPNEYIVDALPNPCYKISTEAIVLESYPEQVIVKSTVQPPNTETVCVQSIQEIFQEGEFEASEQAQVRFEIE